MYDDFADSFSNKRKIPWKPFVTFMESLKSEKQFQDWGMKGVWCDLGAGNGRHLPVLLNYTRKYVGTDISFPLLQLARKLNDPHKLHNWIGCDINALPFRNHSFQCIVSVAVFHHIVTKNQLRLVLKKVTDLLDQNSLLILTVWGAFGGKNESTLKRKNFHRRISHQIIYDKNLSSERLQLGINDIIVPWTTIHKGKIPQKKPRIYHLYSFSELSIFHEDYDIIKKISEHLGYNAGINYFICLVKK